MHNIMCYEPYPDVTKDFSDGLLEPYGIEAQHPDEFLSHLLDLNDAEVCDSVRAVRARLRNPPIA